MRFSQIVPVIGALVGFAQASPAPIKLINAVPNLAAPAAMSGDLEARTLKPCTFHLAREWHDETLFKGGAGPHGISLGLALPKAAISGDIDIQVTDKFLKEPTIRVGLGGLKAYFEVDIAASAALFESVELVSSGRLNLDLPGLLKVDVGAAFALDLVIGISAAVHVHGGFYIHFPKDAFVEISVLSKEIVRQSLDGIVAQPLDLALGASIDLAAAVDVTIGLRLRSAIGIGAEVGLIGLDLIDTSADIIIWVDLFSYTATLIRTPKCAVFVEESLALGLGIAVELDVSVADALSLEIAPKVFITISKARLVGFCLPAGAIGGHPGSGHGHPSGLPTGPSGGLPKPTGGLPGSGPGNGLPSGIPTGGLPVPTGGLPGSGPGNGLPSGGLPVPTGGLPGSGPGNGLPSGIPSGGLPVPTGGLPGSGPGNGLPSGLPSGGLPIPTGPGNGLPSGLPTGGLPVPTGGLPGSGPGNGLPSGVPTGPSGSVPTGSNPGSGSPSDVPSGPAGGAPVPTGSNPGSGNGSATSSTAGGMVTPAPSGYTTSTISVTKTYTITSCHASVKNCPASMTQKVVTSTVIEKTTVCPVGAPVTSEVSSATQTTCSVPEPTNKTQVTTVTLTTCPFETSTLTVPSGVPTPEPTVTITDSPSPTPTGPVASNPNPPQPSGTGNVQPPRPTGTGPAPSAGAPPTYVASESVPYPTEPAASNPPVAGGETATPPKPTAPVAAVTSAPPVTAGAAKMVGGFAALAMPVLAMML